MSSLHFPLKESPTIPKTLLKWDKLLKHKTLKMNLNIRKSYKKRNWTSTLQRPRMNRRTSKSRFKLIVWQTTPIMATLIFR